MKIKDINNGRDLADFFKMPYSKLTYILYAKKPSSYYISFEIPKKSGGVRSINAPVGDLKSLQRQFAAELYQCHKDILEDNKSNQKVSHGFEKGKSIITNAKIHKNKNVLINIDLKDFFESFHFGRVAGYFEKNNYFKLPHDVAIMMAQLTCYKGALPQGAPTSPIITNLICQILDYRILAIAQKYRLDYTRYADDMTFSTNNIKILEEYEEFMEELRKEIEKAGFKINEDKTRIQKNNNRQTVTGLTINKKINVDYRYYKHVRACADSLYRKGETIINGKKGTLNQLEGMFSFINEIDKYNNINSQGTTRTYENLNGREEQYRKFLFYKLFWNPNKPTIITEGKTDILYIKAALKNLYLEYPVLIEKTSKGNFLFNVNFIRRSKKTKYFLGLSEGADSAKNFYMMFSDDNNKNIKNYNKIFEKIAHTVPKYPTIMIFDNELSNPNKPLKKFITAIRLKETHKTDLENKLFCKTNQNNQIYIVTNPLVDNKTECEIEDLFDHNTLSHTINGKHFSKDSNADNQKYYSKEIFSKYVASHYNAINFEKFKPMLNVINDIVSTFEYPNSK